MQRDGSRLAEYLLWPPQMPRRHSIRRDRGQLHRDPLLALRAHLQLSCCYQLDDELQTET